MSRDAKKAAPLPYEDWWQTVGLRTLRRPREVIFQTGRAWRVSFKAVDSAIEKMFWD